MIPEIDINDIIRHPVDIEISDFTHRDGNVSVQELVIIASLAKYCNVHRAFEIGTFDGRTTLNLALNCYEVITLDLPQSSLGKTMFPVDGFNVKYVDKLSPGQRYRSTPVANRITQLYGDSAMFDTTPYLHSCDLVFVDGCHSYDYTRNDSLKAIELAKYHRIILWHDYGTCHWPAVTQAINDLAGSVSFSSIRKIKGTSLAVALT